MADIPIDEATKLIASEWGILPNACEAVAFFEHDDPAAIEADFRRSIDPHLVKSVICELRPDAELQWPRVTAQTL